MDKKIKYLVSPNPQDKNLTKEIDGFDENLKPTKIKVIIEKDLTILDKYQAVLLYGENDGIKDTVKSKLKLLNKNTEIINFFESEIIKNKNILYENIINDSLFNNKKIILLQSATDKTLKEISESLEKENLNIKIYIFSDKFVLHQYIIITASLANFFPKYPLYIFR